MNRIEALRALAQFAGARRPSQRTIDPSATPLAVNTVSIPPNAGMTSGGGSYQPGAQVTVIATPNIDHHFVDWSYVNGLVASHDASYTFELVSATDLIANFGEGEYAPIEPPPVVTPVLPINVIIGLAGHLQAAIEVDAIQERFPDINPLPPQQKEPQP